MIGRAHILALFFSAALVFSSRTSGFAQANLEFMKAAYLYNFGKYIKWPEEFPTFVIGVYGTTPHPFADVLEDALSDRRVAGKPITIRQVSGVADANECNILYFPAGENLEVAGMATALSGKPVLLVTEDNMVRKGAMMSFHVEDDRLKFILRKELITRAGLVPSEGLLRIATLY